MLAFKGWNREMRRRRSDDYQRWLERREALLKSGLVLRPDTEVWTDTTEFGKIALIVVGSWATEQLPEYLRSVKNVNAGKMISAVLVLEPDVRVRDRARLAITDTAPEFLKRIIWAHYPMVEAGLGGEPIERVQAMHTLWGEHNSAAINAFIKLVDAGPMPIGIMPTISSGGCVALADPALAACEHHFPDVPIFLTTLIDQKHVVRQRFPKTRQLLTARDRLTSFTVLDNRRFPSRSDRAHQRFTAAAMGATPLGDTPLSGFNAYKYVHATPGQCDYSTFSTVVESLPVAYGEPFEDLEPAIWVTRAVDFERRCILGIQRLVEQRALQSVPLPAASSDRTRVVIVAAPIRPDPDMRQSGGRILRGLESWREATEPELLIYFTSLGDMLEPHTTNVDMTITLLQPLADTGAQIDAWAQNTISVDDLEAIERNDLDRDDTDDMNHKETTNEREYGHIATKDQLAAVGVSANSTTH